MKIFTEHLVTQEQLRNRIESILFLQGMTDGTLSYMQRYTGIPERLLRELEFVSVAMQGLQIVE